MAERVEVTNTRIVVKVAAGASHSVIGDWHDQCLKVRLSTAPERDKANAALIALLAQALGLSKKSINIVRGQHSSRKTLEIYGLSLAQIIRLLKH
jgi:uncharacterized protein YggU (UPF0235/DUF167 family)